MRRASDGTGRNALGTHIEVSPRGTDTIGASIRDLPTPPDREQSSYCQAFRHRLEAGLDGHGERPVSPRLQPHARRRDKLQPGHLPGARFT